jgi:hypothetical protein
MTEELFRAIDAKDPARFASFLSPDCRFRFGNLPEVVGAERVRDFVAGFFDSIESLSHEIRERWSVPGGLVCHGQVTYTRKDGSQLSVPFANVFRIDAAGIREYLIFADTSQLYR